MPNKKSLATSFCHCIKHVRKTVKLRPKQNISKRSKEKAAIAICVKSVLHSKQKTLKRFTCKKKPYLITQPK
jgi:hypothetical protein